MITIRKSSDRGHADHGWLDSYHTFSFASYQNQKFQGFGHLRVLNEDRVKGGSGFGEHPHADFEIFSYVVRGGLKHNDSMGNEEVIKRGEVQFTSAGKGIRHAEFNASKTDLVHFLQLWVKPWQTGLTPSYSTKEFSDEKKLNNLVCFVTKKGTEAKTGGIPINQDFYASATLLDPGKSVEYKPEDQYRRIYIHVVQEDSAAVRVTTSKGEEVILQAGDGAFVQGAEKLTLTGASTVTKKPVEVLILDSVSLTPDK